MLGAKEARAHFAGNLAERHRPLAIQRSVIKYKYSIDSAPNGREARSQRNHVSPISTPVFTSLPSFSTACYTPQRLLSAQVPADCPPPISSADIRSKHRAPLLLFLRLLPESRLRDQALTNAHVAEFYFCSVENAHKSSTKSGHMRQNNEQHQACAVSRPQRLTVPFPAYHMRSRRPASKATSSTANRRVRCKSSEASPTTLRPGNRPRRRSSCAYLFPFNWLGEGLLSRHADSAASAGARTCLDSESRTAKSLPTGLRRTPASPSSCPTSSKASSARRKAPSISRIRSD